MSGARRGHVWLQLEVQEGCAAPPLLLPRLVSFQPLQPRSQTCPELPSTTLALLSCHSAGIWIKQTATDREARTEDFTDRRDMVGFS